MKHILLFGAGKSATVLINYLQHLSKEKSWSVTIADANITLLNDKVKETAYVNKVLIEIEDASARQKLIEKSDVVISMMPPQLHFLIAMDCILFKKHLLTASYLDDKIKALAPQIKDNNLLFLYEMGLDPGIDHMSAMQLINEIKNKGGKITSFKSHCGGLIAPESDDNPWHYKISWNPKNVVNAGKVGATIKEKENIKFIPYEKLFNPNNRVVIKEDVVYSYYANRDSLSYMPLYQLEDAETFLRTTLRHPEFCIGWKTIIDLKLTDEEERVDTTNLSLADFFALHFNKHHLNSFVNDLMCNNEIAKAQLNYLGINDTETFINKAVCSTNDILQFILEKKWVLQPNDKDLIIMFHELEYCIENKNYYTSALLQIKGKNNSETAMATTVGLPLGIATRLILEEKINLAGLQIPTNNQIYTPVLEALKEYNIEFEEKTELLS